MIFQFLVHKYIRGFYVFLMKQKRVRQIALSKPNFNAEKNRHHKYPTTKSKLIRSALGRI